jgi:putative ABC transport system permease protein
VVPRALWTKAPLALVRHPIGFLAVLAAALLIAMGAAAAPLMNAGVESEALQNKLQQLTPLGAGLTIERSGPPDANVPAADARRRAAAVALARTLPSVGAPVLTTTTYAELSKGRTGIGNPLLVVPMARTAATSHVERLVGDGRGAWLSQAVNGLDHFAPGDSVELQPQSPSSRKDRVRLRVGAVYRQLDLDLSNPYWVNFTARIRTRNPDLPLPPTFVLVEPRDVYRIAQTLDGGSVSNVFEFPIDTRGMTPQRAKDVARAFESVRRSPATRKRLGCGRCSITSSLVDAVRLASSSDAALTPVVTLLAGFCVLLALAAAVVAGGFTARRRAGESRLSLVLGERAVAYAARTSLEALIPALAGASIGLAAAVELTQLLAPRGTVDSSVFGRAVALVAGSVLVSAVAVAVGATVARGRLVPRRRALRLPWELLVGALAAATALAVVSGGGLVKNGAAGSHPRLIVLVLPALVAAAVAGAGARVARSLLGRRAAADAPLPVFLAVRRLAAARGLLVVVVVTSAVGIAALSFAQILRSSLAANTLEKAYVANGSDVQGIVDAGRPPSTSFPYPATVVTESYGAGQFASGRSFELIAVDPPTLERVLAAHWPSSVRDAAHKLASSRARLPAIAIGAGRGTQDVTLGGVTRQVDVVATPRLFPGMVPGSATLVVPARVLDASPGGGYGYVWASGPPALVERALARSDLAPSYMTRATDVSRSADVTTVTKTYGLLRVVAIAFALIALVGLLLYLNARSRSQLVSSEFMRRMGLPERAQAASVSLEAALLVAFSTAVGLGAAVATSGLIVDRLDPLPQYAPSATTVVPWGELLGAAAAVVVTAAVLGAVVSIAVRRDGIGEALRVA